MGPDCPGLARTANRWEEGSEWRPRKKRAGHDPLHYPTTDEDLTGDCLLSEKLVKPEFPGEKPPRGLRTLLLSARGRV